MKVVVYASRAWSTTGDTCLHQLIVSKGCDLPPRTLCVGWQPRKPGCPPVLEAALRLRCSASERASHVFPCHQPPCLLTRTAGQRRYCSRAGGSGCCMSPGLAKSAAASSLKSPLTTASSLALGSGCPRVGTVPLSSSDAPLSMLCSRGPSGLLPMPRRLRRAAGPAPPPEATAAEADLRCMPGIWAAGWLASAAVPVTCHHRQLRECCCVALHDNALTRVPCVIPARTAIMQSHGSTLVPSTLPHSDGFNTICTCAAPRGRVALSSGRLLGAAHRGKAGGRHPLPLYAALPRRRPQRRHCRRRRLPGPAAAAQVAVSNGGGTCLPMSARLCADLPQHVHHGCTAALSAGQQ